MERKGEEQLKGHDDHHTHYHPQIHHAKGICRSRGSFDGYADYKWIMGDMRRKRVLLDTTYIKIIKYITPNSDMRMRETEYRQEIQERETEKRPKLLTVRFFSLFPRLSCFCFMFWRWLGTRGTGWKGEKKRRKENKRVLLKFYMISKSIRESEWTKTNKNVHVICSFFILSSSYHSFSKIHQSLRSRETCSTRNTIWRWIIHIHNHHRHLSHSSLPRLLLFSFLITSTFSHIWIFIYSSPHISR